MHFLSEKVKVVWLTVALSVCSPELVETPIVKPRLKNKPWSEGMDDDDDGEGDEARANEEAFGRTEI